MNKIKKLLEKIKKYLNSLFSKQSIKLIEANTSYNQEEINSNEISTKYIETEKDDFFTIYKNVKNGTIKITDLMINDLIQVQLMMQKEIGIFDEKIEEVEDEILGLDTEISMLEKDRKMYIKQLQKTN